MSRIIPESIRAIQDLFSRRKAEPSARENEASVRRAMQDAVVPEVKPKLSEDAKIDALAASLSDRLPSEQDHAIEALGNFDEDRLRKLLED